jgi:hypothetical protein
VVGEVSFEEVVAALLPCQETLRREINANVYGGSEFREQAKRRGEILSRVLEGPLLMIFGTAEGIGKSREIRQYQGE